MRRVWPLMSDWLTPRNHGIDSSWTSPAPINLIDCSLVHPDGGNERKGVTDVGSMVLVALRLGGVSAVILLISLIRWADSNGKRGAYKIQGHAHLPPLARTEWFSLVPVAYQLKICSFCRLSY